MLRKSCGNCHFTNTQRPSDITMADFWGWEKTNPDINADDKGVSLILVNTEKGRKLFEEASKDLDVILAKLENCLQPGLCKPFAPHSKRNDFERDYKNKGFEYVYKKYGEDNWRKKVEKLVGKIKRNVKKTLYKVLKPIVPLAKKILNK